MTHAFDCTCDSCTITREDDARTIEMMGVIRAVTEAELVVGVDQLEALPLAPQPAVLPPGAVFTMSEPEYVGEMTVRHDLFAEPYRPTGLVTPFPVLDPEGKVVAAEAEAAAAYDAALAPPPSREERQRVLAEALTNDKGFEKLGEELRRGLFDAQHAKPPRGHGFMAAREGESIVPQPGCWCAFCRRANPG